MLQVLFAGLTLEQLNKMAVRTFSAHELGDLAGNAFNKVTFFFFVMSLSFAIKGGTSRSSKSLVSSATPEADVFA